MAELAVLAANDSNGEMRRHSPFTFGEGPSPGFFDHFSTQWSSSRVNKQAAADFRKKTSARADRHEDDRFRSSLENTEERN